MTPLMLRDQLDYLSAGTSSRQSGIDENGRRILVDRLIEDEKERQQNPSGSSEEISPAVSPAA